MRYILLTQNRRTIVDDTDYETLSKFRWYFHRGRAVRKSPLVSGKRKGFIWMHRAIMNPPENMIVDHINHNTLDNRRSNLRVCSQSQNEWNTKTYKNSTTGVKNIYWHKHKKRFVITFQKYGKKISFGQFKTLEEAIIKRNSVVNDVHEGFGSVIQVFTGK